MSEHRNPLEQKINRFILNKFFPHSYDFVIEKTEKETNIGRRMIYD